MPLSAIEKLSRLGISAASTATAVGFSAARYSTSLGFGIGRTATSSVARLVGNALDYTFVGSSRGTGDALGSLVSNAFNTAESIALAPILIGETIASTSLVAASGSLDALSLLFGSDEASFSLASFAQLVKREWQSPVLAEYLPSQRFTVVQMARALIAWAAIQGVTMDYTEQGWFLHLREITESEKRSARSTTRQLSTRDESVHITEDILLPEQDGQIVSADIGSPDSPSDSPPLEPTGSGSGSPEASTTKPGSRAHSRQELLPSLRRLSKLALAGYGGAGMLFFGVPLRPSPPPLPPSSSSSSEAAQQQATANEQLQKEEEESMLASVVSDSQKRGSSSSPHPGPSQTSVPPPPPPPPVVPIQEFSWWDVLMGKHDREIFESYAFSSAPSHLKSPSTSTPPSNLKHSKNASIILGQESRMPRFWVLTDHSRKEVVLVLRGTMSFNELAVDLTCEPVPFTPAHSSEEWQPTEDVPEHLFDDEHYHTQKEPKSPTEERHLVHGGILKLAKVMGGRGKPLHTAIRNALKRNPGYELVMCGHSLGGGVVALLALMWADPKTCLTVHGSGLPPGRRVSGLLIAPPCLTSKSLSTLSNPLLTSFVYSHDVVSRLSLGSVRDLTRAAMWLCTGTREETPMNITKRALMLHNQIPNGFIQGMGGADTKGEVAWFLSLRKTLEANMGMADLFPPGRVLWAIDDQDLQPSSRRHADSNELRLFEVKRVDKVFNQIVFSRRMLGSHMPHQYDRVIHELK